MIPQPPPGQGPIDPRGAFAPPPAPNQPHGAPGAFQSQMGGGGFPPPPHGMMPPPGMMPPGGGGYPPPMFMMPPGPPHKPHRSFARGIFLTLATTIFGLSLTL